MKRIYNKILEEKFRGEDDFNKLISQLPVQQTHLVGFVNPFSYSELTRKTDIVDGFDAWFVDGELLCWLTNLKRHKKVDRVSFDFSSVASKLFAAASEASCSVGLVGGTLGELRGAVDYFKKIYPELRIGYSRHGFFKRNMWATVMDEIADSRPDIVIVGTGSPSQELFLLELQGHLKNDCLLLTCGGFISQTGLKGDYYPSWIKKTGLRWLYRALKHSHVRERLFRCYPVFFITYLVESWDR